MIVVAGAILLSRPAFMPGSWPLLLASLVGLFVGPLFLVAELAFVLGMRREVQADTHERLRRAPASRVSGQARGSSP